MNLLMRSQVLTSLHSLQNSKPLPWAQALMPQVAQNPVGLSLLHP